MTGPVPKPVPMLTWTAITSVERSITAKLNGYDREYGLHWGDHTSGTVVTKPTNAVRKPTPYPAAGAYMLTARDTIDRNKIIAQEQVVVRDGTGVSGVTFSVDPNDAQRIIATFGEVTPEGVLPRISIDWGDGSEHDVVWAIPGTRVTRRLEPGTYTRMVRDLGTKRWTRTSYTVNEDHADPDGTFSQAKPDDPMTVRFTVTSLSESKTIDIDWGDGEVTSITSPQVGSTLDHTYEFEDVFMPWVTFAEGGGRPFASMVKIPFIDEGEHR